MPNAIRIHEHGGPEVMRWEEVRVAEPAEGEVTVRHTAIGVNFSDVNVRRGGFYLGLAERFPVTLGNEAAGVVEKIGVGVTGLSLGDRVAYAGVGEQFPVQTGAYAEIRNVPVRRLIRLPDDIDDVLAAGLLVKSLTASLVVRHMGRPTRGDAILVHAAASGVGGIIAQWSKHLGATVIGTVGSLEKAQQARQFGCDHTILYREQDFVSEAIQLVPKGVDIVFDGVGGETFERSLECLAPFGRLINYGNAAGHIPQLDVRLLSRRSLSVGRAGLGTYLGQFDVMQAAVAEIFEAVRGGVLKLNVWKTYPLAEAARAHTDIETRQSAGAIVLIP